MSETSIIPTPVPSAKERHATAMRKYQAKNPEKSREASRRYYAKNTEKKKAAVNTYRRSILEDAKAMRALRAQQKLDE